MTPLDHLDPAAVSSAANAIKAALLSANLSEVAAKAFERAGRVQEVMSNIDGVAQAVIEAVQCVVEGYPSIIVAGNANDYDRRKAEEDEKAWCVANGFQHPLQSASLTC